MNDTELIQEILKGEQQYYETLLKRYLALAQSVCASHVRYQASHDDIIQDSFIHAYTKLGTLRNRERFGPWLCTIVRNKSRDWLRKHKNTETLAQTLSEEPPVHLIASPEDILMREELREWLRGHLARLPESTREAMSLCFIDGFEQSEAADFLGISLSALKKRLQYGRTQLSERIWGELEHVEESPKKEQATLSGAIMLSLNQMSSPKAHTLPQQLSDLIMSKTSLGVIGLALVAMIFALFLKQISFSHSPNTSIPIVVAHPPLKKSIVHIPQSTDNPNLVAKPSVTAQSLEEDEPDPAKADIEGLLLNDVTHKPIPGVTVILQTDVDIHNGTVTAKMITGSDGRFSTPIPSKPHSKLLWSLGEPYTARFKRAVSTHVATSVRPDPQKVTLYAQVEGSITGYVRYPDGTPIPGIQIRRNYNLIKGNHGYVCTSDEQGRFGFTHDGGLWDIYADSRLTLKSDVTYLDLLPDENMNVDLVLPRGLELNVRIRAEDGTIPQEINHISIITKILKIIDGKEEVRLSIFGIPTYNNIGAQSIYKEGSFTFSPAEKGEYQILVKAEGYEKPSLSKPFTLNSETTGHYITQILSPQKNYEKPIISSKPIDVESNTWKRHYAHKSMVNWSTYDAQGNQLQHGGHTVLFVINEETGKCQSFRKERIMLDKGSYFFILAKDGFHSTVQYITLDEDEVNIKGTFSSGGGTYGTLPDHKQGLTKFFNMFDFRIFPLKFEEDYDILSLLS